jgi:hypothetical protein
VRGVASSKYSFEEKETEGKAPYDITEASVEKPNTSCENREMEIATERKYSGVEHAGPSRLLNLFRCLKREGQVLE